MVEQCLQHLHKQSVNRAEIIVVDGSSNQQTAQIVGQHPSVQYIFFDNGQNKMVKARNLGIAASRGEIIAFVDDDSMVQPGWIEAILGGYSQGSIGGVGGLVLDEHETRLETLAIDTGIGKVLPDGQLSDNFASRLKKPVEVDRLRGCNMSFCRSAIEKVGGFDPVYDAVAYSIFEEVDLCTRIRRAGYTLIFEPRAEVHHLNAPREDGLPRNVDNRHRMHAYARNRTYFVLMNFGWIGSHIVNLFWFDTVHQLYLFVKQPSGNRLGLFTANVAGKLAGVVAAAWRVRR
jgi:GT2 family glycosyltransferase